MNDLTGFETVPMEQLRDSVMEGLVRHYSLENLDLDEFERRTEQVSKATSSSELLAQISDLPELPSQRGETGTVSSTGSTSWRIASGNVKPNDFSVAIFGGSDFRGAWQAPRNLSALCVFGGSSIDLRKAVVPAEGVTINCLCVFGGVDVIVPPGMRLHVRGMGIFGGFDRSDNQVDDPIAPTIVIEGLALFGGVSVRVRD